VTVSTSTTWPGGCMPWLASVEWLASRTTSAGRWSSPRPPSDWTGKH